MAYSSIGVPRFFVNILDWLDATGEGFTQAEENYDPDIHMTLPVVPRQVHWESFHVQGVVGMTENSFVAILGHNLNSTTGSTGGISWGPGSGIQIEMNGGFYNDPAIKTDDIVINQCHYAIDDRVDYDGFSIMSFDGRDKTFFQIRGITTLNTGEISTVFDAGSIIIGTFYDMKNAPNLSLTMSRDFGSSNEITTYNGSTMSNTMASKAPMWGPLGAWEMADYGHNATSQKFSRSGRRTWQLKWSFMDKGDLWGSNQYLRGIPPSEHMQSLGGPIEDDDLHDNEWVFNLITEDSWFSSVWSKTLGGTIPFLFQPDNSNINEWAIARFKNSTLKATQTSPGLYDIAVSIEEAW